MKTLAHFEKEAIRAAAEKKWSHAIKTNLKLLKTNPQDLPSLLRLGWAYINQGQKKLAQTVYRKVLKIDQYNSLAKKNLERLGTTRQGIKESITPDRGQFSIFIEEPGKTKVISLVRLASAKVLNCLQCADPVKLVPKNKFISITSGNNQYLGIIPDDISFRMLKMIKQGNQYQAWIKKIDPQMVQIFVREVHRSQRYQNQPSFPVKATPKIFTNNQ